MMKASFLLCFLSLPFKTEGYQSGVFNNDYEPSVISPHDSRLPPGPYSNFNEELVVNQVVEESSDFKIKARNVKQWLRLRLDTLYLLGISDTEVNLVSMYKVRANKYQAHEYPLALRYKVSCGVMFKSRPLDDDTHEGVVLLALSSPVPVVSVYKIKNYKLHHIIDWKRDHSVHAITYFKWNNEDRFIIFEDHKNLSLATVYGFEFDNHAPHFWQIEMISLGSTRGHPTLGQVGGDTLFLATIQGNDKAVSIYSYKKVCDGALGNKFELELSIPDLNAEKIEFFHAYGHLYFIVSGSPSVLYRITPDGHLAKDIIFGTFVDIIPIPIKSARHDTILLGKSIDGTPHVYTFVGSGMWEEKLVPKCRRSNQHGNELVLLKECIGGNRSWEGATYIGMEADQYPSILFADRQHSSELYYLPFSFIKIPHIPQSVHPSLLEQLESYWKNLRTSLKRFIMARSQEGSSQSIFSSCIIKKEVNDMHSLLSRIKLDMDWTDCSASDFRMDVTSSKKVHVIADEAKPIETITLPNKRTSNHNLQPRKDSSTNGIQPYEQLGIAQSSHLDYKQIIPISPEISNDALDNRGLVNEQLEGFDEIYSSNRR